MTNVRGNLAEPAIGRELDPMHNFFAGRYPRDLLTGREPRISAPYTWDPAARQRSVRLKAIADTLPEARASPVPGRIAAQTAAPYHPEDTLAAIFPSGLTPT